MTILVDELPKTVKECLFSQPYAEPSDEYPNGYYLCTLQAYDENTYSGCSICHNQPCPCLKPC